MAGTTQGKAEIIGQLNALTPLDAVTLMALGIKPEGVFIIDALAEAIRDLTALDPDGALEGHLYANVASMIPVGMYGKIIDVLVALGAVARSGHVVRWVRQ